MNFAGEYYRFVAEVQQIVLRRADRMEGLRRLAQDQLSQDRRAGMYRNLSDAQLRRILDAKYSELVDNDVEVRGLASEIRDAQQAAIMYGFGALLEQQPVPR